MKVIIPFYHATLLQRVTLFLLWVVFQILTVPELDSKLVVYTSGTASGMLIGVLVVARDMSRHFKFEDTDVLTKL